MINLTTAILQIDNYLMVNSFLLDKVRHMRTSPLTERRRMLPNQTGLPGSHSLRIRDTLIGM
jgi:hypothetical protein